IYASGDRWPSVDELRVAMNNSLPRSRQITSVAGGKEIPEPMALAVAYASANDTTFLESMQAVLPGWMERNPAHEDYRHAADWWRRFGRAKPWAGGLGAAQAFRSIGKD